MNDVILPIHHNPVYLDLFSKQETKLTLALEQIFLKPVIYDEIEFFSNKNLEYPYKKRKSNIQTFPS